MAYGLRTERALEQALHNATIAIIGSKAQDELERVNHYIKLGTLVLLNLSVDFEHFKSRTGSHLRRIRVFYPRGRDFQAQ